MERCAGIDIGKRLITVCILIGTADAELSADKCMFGTFHNGGLFSIFFEDAFVVVLADLLRHGMI